MLVLGRKPPTIALNETGTVCLGTLGGMVFVCLLGYVNDLAAEINRVVLFSKPPEG